jgi:hypothetical protein
MTVFDICTFRLRRRRPQAVDPAAVFLAAQTLATNASGRL